MIGLVKDARNMISDLNRESAFMRVWGPALNVPHVLGGLVFIGRYEAALILATSVFSVIVAAQIHKRSPFSRLTSLVHVVWLPLFPLLVQTLMDEGVQRAFSVWLAYVVVTMGISLILDAWNIVLALGTRNKRFHTRPEGASS